MTKPHNEEPVSASPSPELGDLSKRLRDLGSRIAAEETERRENAKPAVNFDGAAGYAKGYRLISEFVAGTLVGGMIGYGFDWLFGTLPFGLIIFLLLGFGAGILGMARAAKRVPPAQERLATNPPPKAAMNDDEEED
jgi:ATP synthase protein I